MINVHYWPTLRPAVDAGRKVDREPGQREVSEAEEKARHELLFNQTNAKVCAAREEAARQAQ